MKSFAPNLSGLSGIYTGNERFTLQATISSSMGMFSPGLYRSWNFALKWSYTLLILKIGSLSTCPLGIWFSLLFRWKSYMVKRNLFFAMVFQKKGVFSIVLNVVVLNQPHPDYRRDEPLHVIQSYVCPFVKPWLRFQVLCLEEFKKICAYLFIS